MKEFADPVSVGGYRVKQVLREKDAHGNLLAEPLKGVEITALPDGTQPVFIDQEMVPRFFEAVMMKVFRFELQVPPHAYSISRNEYVPTFYFPGRPFELDRYLFDPDIPCDTYTHKTYGCIFKVKYEELHDQDNIHLRIEKCIDAIKEDIELFLADVAEIAQDNGWFFFMRMHPEMQVYYDFHDHEFRYKFRFRCCYCPDDKLQLPNYRTKFIALKDEGDPFVSYTLEQVLERIEA